MGFLEEAVESLSGLGLAGLVVISFLEASVFPIPPDVVLIPLVLIDPGNALLYGVASTLSSAAGALLGYLIGLRLGRPVAERLLRPGQLERAESMYRRYGLLAVAVAAFSPIPFKVFTITSGLLRLGNLPAFLAVSILGRGARLIPEAILIGLWGREAITLVEENLTLSSIIGALILIVAYILYRRLTTRRTGETSQDNSSR